MIGVVACLALAPTARADEALLRTIAQQVTHGWVHDRLAPAELDRRFAAGHRLFLTCGTVSLLRSGAWPSAASTRVSSSR